MLFQIETAADGRAVIVWSKVRPTFEPKGALSELRAGICESIRSLEHEEGLILHAVYASADREPCDVENILLYNIGQTCFTDAAREGIRFERSFTQPTKSPLDGAAHMMSYRLERKEDAYSHWVRGQELAAWEDVEIKGGLTLASVWRSVRSSPDVRVISRRRMRNFGLTLAVSSPRAAASPNVAGIVKPLIDGIVAAFHAHDGSDFQALSNILGKGIPEGPEQAAKLLQNETMAVLGTRRLLWRRASGVQWNPDDENCVAAEVLPGGPTADWNHRISGQLYEVSLR